MNNDVPVGRDLIAPLRRIRGVVTWCAAGGTHNLTSVLSLPLTCWDLARPVVMCLDDGAFVFSSRLRVDIMDVAPRAIETFARS
jgi:hypothetical protein